MVITGIYVQPKRTKEIALDLLKTICGLLHDVATQNQVSRKIMGDFNVTSRSETYGEWRGEMGLWELHDPDKPTYTTGASLETSPTEGGGGCSGRLLVGGIISG